MPSKVLLHSQAQTSEIVVELMHVFLPYPGAASPACTIRCRACAVYVCRGSSIAWVQKI